MAGVAVTGTSILKALEDGTVVMCVYLFIKSFLYIYNTHWHTLVPSGPPLASYSATTNLGLLYAPVPGASMAL